MNSGVEAFEKEANKSRSEIRVRIINMREPSQVKLPRELKEPKKPGGSSIGPHAMYVLAHFNKVGEVGAGEPMDLGIGVL